MYRKVNSSNINNPNQVEIPECLLQELKSENEQKIQEIRDREEKLMQLQLRIFYSGDEKTIVIRKDKTLNQLKIKAIAEFKLEHIRNEDIRLRNYNAQQDIYLNTYTGKET